MKIVRSIEEVEKLYAKAKAVNERENATDMLIVGVEETLAWLLGETENEPYTGPTT